MAEAPAAGSEADTGAVSRRPHSAANSPRDAALAAAASLYIRALWPFKLFAVFTKKRERECVRARERAARTLPVGSITAVGVQCRRPHRVAYVMSCRCARPCGIPLYGHRASWHALRSSVRSTRWWAGQPRISRRRGSPPSMSRRCQAPPSPRPPAPPATHHRSSLDR